MSEGDGSYTHESGTGGEIESSLTALYPYARWSATDRLDLWGLVGMGTGDLLIRYGEREHETDLAMRMGAIGARGTILSSEESALDLAVRTDAMWVGTESDAVEGKKGKLAGAKADVTRVRLILEGSRPVATAGEGTFTPSAQVGLRHDAGDAETGIGVEVGGGFTFARGVFEVGAQARALVAHADEGYEEWGAAGHLRVPRPGVDVPAVEGRLSFLHGPVTVVEGAESFHSRSRNKQGRSRGHHSCSRERKRPPFSPGGKIVDA